MRVCPRCNLKYQDDITQCFVDGEVLEEAPDPYIGTTIAGRYYIEGKLGEGGMATVYRARLTLVDRPVAVKIMNPQYAKDRRLRERFRREAKNAAAVQHPNIIEIYDTGDTDDGTAFLVMEILDGCSLNDMIARGAMTVDVAIPIVMQIAQGLARAHDFDVIHRDLKPDNIFLCTTAHGPPHVKLLDFGIARSMHDERLTNAGEIFGTPHYMAPERITSIDAGASADLYAVGIILYEMLVGEPPFVADEITQYFLKHMTEKPVPASERVEGIPRKLDELILSLLEKKPESRPVDAHEVIKTLVELMPKGLQQPSVAPPAAVPTPSKPVIAPTLPPTTLDRWAKRTALFERMLERAFPRGDAPHDIIRLLGNIRGDLMRIHELRHDGLKEQRKLEELEQEARESRTRMGHAVQMLGEDMSRARGEVRSARVDVQPYFDADDSARAAYRKAHQKLTARGGDAEQEEPTPEMVNLMRDAVDALDRWLLARGASEKAQRWVDAKQAESDDLEYQIKMLRKQLQSNESEYELARQASEEMLEESGREAQTLERDLIAKATQFCEALRPKAELGDLFAQLEAEGGA